jgi:hypothetical protein
VQHRAHFLGRQVDGRLAVVTAHEAVPVLVAFDLAFEFAEQRRTGSTSCRLDGFFDDKIFR